MAALSASFRSPSSSVSCTRSPSPAAGLPSSAPLLPGAIYNYSLASPTSEYPHGVLSEDGFYKVVVNDTSLWFQLCDRMIFNHDQPKCYGCQDCGGPSHCGMNCSAVLASEIGGYPVCTTIGSASSLYIDLIDPNNPLKGVVVNMSSTGCSLAVSVFCDSNKAQVTNMLNLTGKCDYVVELRHPSGCAEVINIKRNGWGWFRTLMMTHVLPCLLVLCLSWVLISFILFSINGSFISNPFVLCCKILCLLVGYVLVGTVYRFFFLGIHGAEAIPNLGFWLSLPYRAKIMLGNIVRRFSGRSRDSRASYSPVNH